MKKLLLQQKTIWVLIIVLVPVLAWLAVTAYENRYVALPVYSTFPAWEIQGDTALLHNYVLYDQDEHATSLNDSRDKIVIVNYFFTRCPVVCPKLMKQVKRVRDAFVDDDLVQFRSFSVDPNYDTAIVLRRFAERYGVDGRQWKLVTGDKPRLYRLARNGFKITATDGDGGPSDFIHSEQLIVLDPRGQIRGYYAGTDPQAVNQLIHDIKKLEHEL